MATIQVEVVQGQMSVSLHGIPAFPNDVFGLGIPECIGDAARPIWFDGTSPRWSRNAQGLWVQHGHRPDEMEYDLTVRPADDHVDLEIRLTNLSNRQWKRGMAFNCFNCGASSLRDNECLRHYVAERGRIRRLIKVPRVFGPRPTVQLYSVEGAPPGNEIPFVASFGATPTGVTLEGWMAIVSPDGKRLVAAASRPALFLFQNMEYSCIHSGPGFGSMDPGQTSTALTRLYFVQATLPEWHRRVRAEMGPAEAGLSM